MENSSYNHAHPGPVRILIVRVGAMGDILHGLPAVAALRQRFPESYIGWAVEPRWKALLEPTPVSRAIVDRVHLVPTREWKRRPFSLKTVQEIMALRDELRGESYDVCIDIQGLIRSSIIGWMAGASRYVGSNEPREPLARRLYGERVKIRSPHVIDKACELVSVGVGEVLRPVTPELPADPAAEAWCDEYLRTTASGPRGFVLFSPAAGWGAKTWPVDRWRELAQQLAVEGYTVLINAGGPMDRAITGAVADGGRGYLVDCGIAELIALTRRAKLVVGGDTGPVHLAALLGRPVVSLYGPTHPRRTGPFFPGARVRVLRHGSSTLHHGRHSEPEAGLAQITELEVFDAALELLNEVNEHG